MSAFKSCSSMRRGILPKAFNVGSYIIHSDFHNMNVLCYEGDIKNMGVVDFMDVLWGPYIFELAGPAMDVMKDRDNPLDGLRPLFKDTPHTTLSHNKNSTC